MSLNIFLSCSGDRSRRIATTLHDWLPRVIQTARPWMDEKDLGPGKRWVQEIGHSLAEHDVGILCITPENLNSPWLAFEAGALSKAMDDSTRVCPVLLGLEPGDLVDSPLSQFQATRLRRDEMLKLLENLNDLQGQEKVPRVYLRDAFDQAWPSLEAKAEEASSLAIRGSSPEENREILRFVRGNLSLRAREQELAENNRFLQAARRARIVAMTYKTLGEALPSLHFPNLREAELCVYALPNLLFTHPVLQGSNSALAVEWVRGLGKTIQAFLDDSRCPQLTHLHLTLFSVAPVLTGTDVLWADEDTATDARRLRLTFVISGSEPEDIPTLVVSQDRERHEPAFEAFQTMMSKVGRRQPPSLRYVLKRSAYTRPDVDAFTRHLQHVSNHPAIGPQDRMFAVRLSLDDEASAPGVYDAFSGSRWVENHLDGTPWRVTWEKPDDVLSLAQEGREAASEAPVEGEHIFACFALMTWNQGVVLVEHKKEGWSCDVPGGKISRVDQTEKGALVREVFEELGLLLDADRISPPLGITYDPKSAREAHKPVVAQYYHYPLERSEREYLFDVAGETTKGNELTHFPLSTLLERKRADRSVIEAVCHAPLHVVERLQETLDVGV